MSENLSRWLTLREPFDAAARSEVLARSVAAMVPADRPVRIVDLGTGRGSNIRYLAPFLPPRQHWLAVDRDQSLLAEIPAAMSTLRTAEIEIETQATNLGALDGGIFRDRDLVTASALLDLVSATWLQSLAGHCRANGAVVLFALSYNGLSVCSPVDREDHAIRELMNEHQRTNDKGFGLAAGPDAVDVAEECFSAVGYRVHRASSDWVLPAEAHELQGLLIDGWAEAATEIAPERAAMIRDWRERRVAHVAAGRSRIIVGHEDLAAYLK